ncbi:hypothetical protein DYU05_05545 [Mucilaginibacter terrenus]|uniref:Uncharacterized protein n=1 Tax=Mucilaginibacter terrenus TaxID=2482727 RepID=A0A3E2NVL9_9SPHI|nr:hypothetical protein [Mucilaginibacter terrenus]RFZ85066.1 hypothetical protein DYU05_05545 [Mucilaginibacter terrenus]
MTSSPQVQDLKLLLSVFREGLIQGVISKEEIVAWADQLIEEADEPDYFLMELALCNDVNCLVELLDKHVIPTANPIRDRVLLALVYQRLPIDEVKEVERVANLVDNILSAKKLTDFENSSIYTFDDYYVHYPPEFRELKVELKNFLTIYNPFTLQNYTHWVNINEQVLELLKEKESQIRS